MVEPGFAVDEDVVELVVVDVVVKEAVVAVEAVEGVVEDVVVGAVVGAVVDVVVVVDAAAVVVEVEAAYYQHVHIAVDLAREKPWSCMVKN